MPNLIKPCLRANPRFDGTDWTTCFADHLAERKGTYPKVNGFVAAVAI
jgi:hypothetical protein